MKLKQIFRIMVFVILFVGVAIYLVFAMLEFRDGNPNEVCADVRIEIEGGNGASFLSEEKVRDILKKADTYPVGQPMRHVNTRKMEEVLSHNTFVERVECYKVPTATGEINKGRVCVKVRLREPVLFVLPNDGEGYYVDDQGMILPNSAYSRNIVTATGHIPRTFATDELAPFGAFLRDNPFWDQQIEQIYVERGSKGQSLVTLVPRVGNHTIYLGTIDKYEQKLRRLKIFYQKGVPEFGWNKYSRLNLEFDNQIVCSKE